MADDDRQATIETAIYMNADINPSFAVAYALIQCAAAFNRIAEAVESVAETLTDLEIKSDG